jgi:hypothetical protein
MTAAGRIQQLRLRLRRCFSNGARAAGAAPGTALGSLRRLQRASPSLPLTTAVVAGVAALVLLGDVVTRLGASLLAPAGLPPVVLAAPAVPPADASPVEPSPVEPTGTMPQPSPPPLAIRLMDPAALPEPAAGPVGEPPGDADLPNDPALAAAFVPGSALPVVPEVPAELDDVARELQRRRAEVVELEAGLALREAALRAAEADLSAQIDRLEAFKQELEALVGEAEAEEEERLQQLVKVYESMRAKSAAAIFDRLELPVILAVATRMREARMAAILAAMDPNRAKIVTSELARERELPRLD